MSIKGTKICIVGLGYVGLPLAVEFSKAGFEVTGFDNDSNKISQLNSGIDPTNEVGQQAVKSSSINFTTDATEIKKSNFIIVAVPTPVDQDKKPDLSIVKNASKIIGQNLTLGSIVVYESTVYPGVTEEICLPILEKESGLKNLEEFKIGYSPERVNPGDKQHTIDKVIKVVSGQDKASLEKISEVYSAICKVGIHKAPTIKVAESSKIVENMQRDLNIAFTNELAMVFSHMEIDTKAVLDAAGTKWNFHHYHPGLVGGHCIGVDPYYFLLKAQELGHDPKMILASRFVNESVADFIAQKVIDKLEDPKTSRVLVMGLSFKENINDFRNSKSKDVINSLQKAGVEVLAHDPLIEGGLSKKSFGVKNFAWDEIENLDGIIYLVSHDVFSDLTLEKLKQKCNQSSVLFDLRRIYKKEEAVQAGFNYLTL